MNLQDRKWKEFRIDTIFKQERGKESAPNQIISKGNIPIINEIQNNNGLSTFGFGKKLLEGNSITVSVNFAQNVFYQQNSFYASVNILVLYSKNLNRYIANFLVSCIRISNAKYNYAYKTSKERLNATKILLPVNSKGEPDYKFMEEYIKERETRLKNQYKNYIKSNISQFKEIKNNKRWKDFALTDIFIPNKGNQNNMSSLTEGDIPLVSAKKFDNGYKMFVSENDKDIYPANIITLNNDGDGGAGIAYYQPAKHLLDSHVTALVPKNKNLSKRTLLYISTAITNQRSKFGHGYSINNNRLKIFRFMLPVNEKGEPDYKFMEDYMKYLEQKKLLEYLDYIK